MHGRELCKSVPDGPAVNVTKASIAPGLCLGRLRSRASALGDADPFTSPTPLSSPPLAFSPFSMASRVLDKRQRLRRAQGLQEHARFGTVEPRCSRSPLWGRVLLSADRAATGFGFGGRRASLLLSFAEGAGVLPPRP